MAIGKQDFYEGAALYALARSGKITSIKYSPPFFLLNERMLLRLKYSTRVRSPWGFTFTDEEQSILSTQLVEGLPIVIGLVCGADGVAALRVQDLLSIASARSGSFRVSCFREHREHYEVRGPDGIHSEKVAPSDWINLLNF